MIDDDGLDPSRLKPFGPEHVPSLAKARRDAGSAVLYERVAEAYEFEWQQLLDRIYFAMREADERAAFLLGRDMERERCAKIAESLIKLRGGARWALDEEHNQTCE